MPLTCGSHRDHQMTFDSRDGKRWKMRQKRTSVVGVLQKEKKKKEKRKKGEEKARKEKKGGKKQKKEKGGENKGGGGINVVKEKRES